MTEPILDQFWECPECGAQVAMGSPAQLRPPHCTFGHSKTEMEQVTASRWGRQFGEARDVS